jgi:hypothetical protein
MAQLCARSIPELQARLRRQLGWLEHLEQGEGEYRKRLFWRV